MQAADPIDSLFVADTPAFQHRAYMLDISRDRVPTLATLEWLVRILGRLRFTELQLYVEHTFTYEGHETVWRDASPMTTTDMRSVSATCAANGMQLVANMNGFGHMGRWLEHDEYQAMAECPSGAPAVFGDGTMPPTCLAPTPENAEFAVELAREMLAAVGSDRIHIGADEPFELGEGWSADLVAQRGRDRVYVEHLNRIIGPLAADGHEVLFWGDLFRRDASLMDDLLPGAVGVVWNYEAPSHTAMSALLPADVMVRLGLPDDAHLGFEAHCRLFVESGRPFWVAPGTGTWNTILGRNANAAANIADAAQVGAAHGAAGFLLADWGDNGHWQPLVVSLPSMVRAAAAAWNGTAVANSSVGPAIDELLTSVPGTTSPVPGTIAASGPDTVSSVPGTFAASGPDTVSSVPGTISSVPGTFAASGPGTISSVRGAGELIDRLGRLGDGLGATLFNGSPFFGALVNTGMPGSGEPDMAKVEAALRTLDQAQEHFAASGGSIRGGIINAEMLAACAMARLGLERMAGREPSEAALDSAVAQQREAWLLSSRPGGLEDSLARLLR